MSYICFLVTPSLCQESRMERPQVIRMTGTAMMRGTRDVLGKKAVASRRMWAMRMEVTTDPAMWMRQLKVGKPGACLSWLPLV